MILADGVYASTEDGRAIAFRGDTGGFTLAQKQVIAQPAVGYTFGDEMLAVDGLLGARYWYLSADLGVDRILRPSTIERSGSRQWVDATAGARIRWNPMPRIRVAAGADGGGGGSRSTCQAYGTPGVDAWSKVTIGVGYRALKVDYDRSNFLFDMRSAGFVLGATIRP